VHLLQNVDTVDIASVGFKKGDVLVTDMTDPDFSR